MKTLYVVFLFTVFNFSWGLPPVRRYGYGNEEAGYRARGLDGYGPRFATGAQGFGDHASWCPMREREALRSRLPGMSRTQGPGYFNYASDGDPLSRYERSHRTNSNTRQNDFTDVDISDFDDGGVNVGGVAWPPRTTSKTESIMGKMNSADRITEDGCHHHKVATLAKDATAAASDAANAAASAVKAAAKAAAAAACNPDGIPDDIPDDTENDDSEDVNTDVSLGYKVVYPNDMPGNRYQDEEVNSEGKVESRVNSYNTDSEDYQRTSDGGVNYQDTSDKEMNSQVTTGSGINSQSPDSEKYSQSTGSGVNSQSTTVSEKSHSSKGSGIYSQASAGSLLNSRNGIGKNSQGTTGNGVNSQSVTNGGGYSQSTKSGVNSKENSHDKNDKVSEGYDGIRDDIRKNFTSTGSNRQRNLSEGGKSDS